MTKKVIFIGGTSFSGSTFFHLTLANDPRGFGTGEVRHLFWPEKERHLRAYWRCGCGDPTCTIWDRVKEGGESHLYQSIFDLHPGVDFIVDSSKNVLWVEQQSQRLARQGIEVYHIVIWKTLFEFAHSLKKRNRLEQGEGLTSWPRYHRLYHSFFDGWRSVKYSNYISQQAAVLQTTCNYLGIPYFEGKERFWEKTHHVLGGNLSSRIHLYSKGSAGYQEVQRRATAGARPDIDKTNVHHREVYYENPDQEGLERYIRELRRESPFIDQIESMLLEHDVANPLASIREWPELKLSSSEKQVRRIYHFIKDRVGRARYGLKDRQLERETKRGAIVSAR